MVSKNGRLLTTAGKIRGTKDMKKLYSKQLGSEVYALAPEQLKVFASSGYEVPTPEAVIADAGADGGDQAGDRRRARGRRSGSGGKPGGNGMTFGTCRYCGQVVNLDYEEETQAEADIAASEKCECYDARHERNLRKQITAAQNRIRKIFGDDAAKLGFAPIAAEEPLQLLNAIAEQTARGFITSATINVRGLCKAKITMTTKEKIKVERSETKTYQLEE